MYETCKFGTRSDTGLKIVTVDLGGVELLDSFRF